MTLPSFIAASISAGVTASGGGAAAITRVENAAPARTAPVPLSTSRREIGLFIGAPNCRFPSLLCGLLLGQIHPRLSFIPGGRSQSFVDSSFPLQLNLRQGIKR